ncbi:phenylacetate--CoA ligase family protein [Desulfomonile tiedjei]|uniref:Phenylacetate-coenzyme A ligase n=1 Tax=Desulfomonile tiedjei (strain ATCC 49306 / DSM 6799 / DCB-1) TaxID=706587 RepID=I4C160_DESTA|nr:phenylacetate--CoA ligase [Desulfomonile tiedjei]AFM23301.1 coenzyme F390 synthetase [Desulfomonile tiedjei DSM 6799]
MAKKYWDEKFEIMNESDMKAWQLQQLKQTVAWVYERVPFYKKAFDNAGVKPSDLQKLEDIAKFPFSVKTDLRDNYPFGLCAVPMSDVVRIHASSGTTGKPITGPYTAEDLNQWADLMARGLWAQEVRPDSILQNAYGMGLFTGGLGFLQGAMRIGCAVVPSGAGMTERQIMLIQDFGTTALCCTPSYCLTIIEKAEKMGIDFRKTNLRTGHFGAEPWTVEMRTEIEARSGIHAYEHYGLTELMGPGVSFTCEYYNIHINEDHVLPEIVDPGTLEPVDLGEEGELIFTSLQRRAMPMIRYRTRDICALRRDKCECGRTLITMDKILGRSDDMMIISGVNVFPSQIETVLMEFEEVEPLYQIRLRKKGYIDHIGVETEVKAAVYQSGQETLDNLCKKISSRIQQVIGINVPITILPPETIERSIGKAKRIIDER